MVNPADREHARRLVERLLAGAEQSLILPCEDDDEPAEITLIRPENLTAEQVGYAYGLDGESLVGGPGYWQAGWLVVGHERDLGDPYFVDLDQELLPVFTAMHGAGTWDPEPVAPSLESFLASGSAGRATKRSS